MRLIVLFSGGLDSTTLLVWGQNQGHDVSALSVNYGQRHVRELTAAYLIANYMGLPLRYVDAHALVPFLAGSSQTSEDIPVPEGHYADPSMRLTVVPNRNMLLLAIAAAHAISEGADGLAYAAHAGDHPVYPDCRPAFIEAMQRALGLCHYTSVQLFTPFATWTKADIVRYGVQHGVPYHLTWSCYKGGDEHCGKCGTCYERREAFALAGFPDPTQYEA